MAVDMHVRPPWCLAFAPVIVRLLPKCRGKSSLGLSTLAPARAVFCSVALFAPHLACFLSAAICATAFQHLLERGLERVDLLAHQLLLVPQLLHLIVVPSQNADADCLICAGADGAFRLVCVPQGDVLLLLQRLQTGPHLLHLMFELVEFVPP